MNLTRKRSIVALAIGFTTIPAVALAATDAVPGDPLKLGQSQRIDKASTVLEGTNQLNDGVLSLRKSGSGIGPVLKVVNGGAGAGRRGIDLTVPAGQPPIAVNADAGKASNLNADKLDGKSEEDFLPSRLYGVATGLVSGPGGGKTVLVSGVSLGCDDGDVALSAGGNAVDAEDHLNGIVPFRSSYQIEFTDNGGASRFSANMICADVSKPFR
ncbi:hypothetical protein [Solirubrobacter soli]|uniref:hypothetical protein n=1 Tax=Solirubrobacter soli TaxID=363832 RepID=UPI000421F445|nr:hypothetical protein [Solirubrobacter soli]